MEKVSAVVLARGEVEGLSVFPSNVSGGSFSINSDEGVRCKQPSSCPPREMEMSCKHLPTHLICTARSSQMVARASPGIVQW